MMQDIIKKFKFNDNGVVLNSPTLLEEEFVKRTKGYQFTKSLYNYDTFDSGIEFQFTGLIDKTKEVKK
jgi:hypothetical protein